MTKKREMKAATGSLMTSGRATLSARGRLPEGHSFYAKIGRVAALSAQLEHLLDLMIWELTKGEQAALSCITGQMIGSGPRFRAIKALCELRGVSRDTLKSITSMETPIFQASLKRNRFLHDAWFQVSEDSTTRQEQFRNKTYKGSDFGFEEVTENHANETMTLIEDHIDELSRVMEILKRELYPSQDK